MVKSDGIHPYSNDHHRRVSRTVLMWTPLVIELLLLAVGVMMLFLPPTEKWLIVMGLALISAGLIGTITALCKRPKLALEPERPRAMTFDEGRPRREHMAAADGMVVASSTTAPAQSYAWFLVSAGGLLLILVASWSIL
jgi:hypothetical protein